jgi:hypothetical protein
MMQCWGVMLEHFRGARCVGLASGFRFKASLSLIGIGRAFREYSLGKDL